MTPNDYIEKAKHAIETGQPNLAMLYMQRGIVILDQRCLVHPYEMMKLAFDQASVGMDRAAFAIQDTFVAIHRFIAGLREANRAASV